MNQTSSIPSEYVYPVDPFVVQVLQSVIGKDVVVETVRGASRGTVAEVKPDHVVLKKEIVHSLYVFV
ncbi:DUF2642 domain-containing protein [Paenibacillus pini]|uniref:DUF2642 domain-containing protein n=1 Tax=Paenibacillus pini JCM 16418 TaxID=1236976 RepID=W7YBK2_9BACL|nr:DUF2642 domain-containing protein [Paenibacillus pini]GAF08200.1 hypothetical protein JCM16418_2241 [Paenibacillus pini JCM 16418]